MRCNVITHDRLIMHGIKLSATAEVAAILDLAESPRGWQVTYQDGVTRMYDPVENVIIGAAQPHCGRNGWTS